MLQAPKRKPHVLDSSSDEEDRFPKLALTVGFNPEATVFIPAEAAGVVSEPERREQTPQESHAEMLADEAADRIDNHFLGTGVGTRRLPERCPYKPAPAFIQVNPPSNDPIYLSEESDEDHAGRRSDPSELVPVVTVEVPVVNQLKSVVSAAAAVAEPEAIANPVQNVLPGLPLFPPLPKLDFKPSSHTSTYMFESAVQREDPHGHDQPIKRTWRPVTYKSGQEAPPTNVEGVCTASNPFGAAPLPKDKAYVLHPGVGVHLIQMTKGRIRGLASDLSTDQKTLLRNDFLEALELWDDAALVTEIDMWKAIEASRYATFNRSYGLADVNVAVKLLIPKWLALDAVQLMEQCWSVEAVRHFDGTSDIATKFLVKETRNKTATTIAAPTKSPPTAPGSVGSGSGKDLSPLSQSRNLSPSPQKQTPRIDATVPDLLGEKQQRAAPPASSAAVPKPTASGMSLTENTRLTLQFDAASAEKERRAVIAMMLPPMPMALSAKPKTAIPITAPVVPIVATTIKTVVVREADKQKDLEKEQLKLGIKASKVQAKIELEEKIRKLEAEKLQLDAPGDSDNPSSSDESVISSDEEWDEEKVALVQSQILYWHEKQRAANAHTSAVPGDPDHDAQKLHLLIRHLKTDYEQKDGRKRKGKIPVISNQADELLARVIANCGSCKRQAQDRKQRKRDRVAQESRQAAEDAEMTRRYQHRLTESEYESDGEHDAKADKFCKECNEKGGRAGRMGKNSLSRDPQDKDELRNCEGPDCFHAFHDECRGLVQATPDGCRRHGMDPLNHITCGRRLEPWLCRSCWKFIGQKQLAYEKTEATQQKNKEEEKERKETEKQAKRARRESSTSSSVKTSLYPAPSCSGGVTPSSSDSSSASNARPESARVGGFSFFQFLETIALKKTLRKGDKKKISFDCQDKQQSSATEATFKPQRSAQKAVLTEFNVAQGKTSNAAVPTHAGARAPEKEDSAKHTAASNAVVPPSVKTRARATGYTPGSAETDIARALTRAGVWVPAEKEIRRADASDAAVITSAAARERISGYTQVPKSKAAMPTSAGVHVRDEVRAEGCSPAEIKHDEQTREEAWTPAEESATRSAMRNAVVPTSMGARARETRACAENASWKVESEGKASTSDEERTPERDSARKATSSRAPASTTKQQAISSNQRTHLLDGNSSEEQDLDEGTTDLNKKRSERKNDVEQAQQATRVALTVDGMPWRTWAGLDRNRYDAEAGPPPNSSEQVYEGDLTEQGSAGEIQRLYGNTRKLLLTLVQSEAGLSDKVAASVELNKMLEHHMNVQQAVVAVARTYHIALPTVTESFRERIPWDTEEAWENHWRRSQSGFIKSRGEARLTAKNRITNEAKVGEAVALELFNRHFRASGRVEESIVAAIREGEERSQAEQERKTETLAAPAANTRLECPQGLHDRTAHQTQTGATIAPGNNAATATPLAQEPESPVTKELRLQEEAEARADDLAFKHWVKEYHRKTKSLFTPAHGANEGDHQEHGGQTPFQGMEGGSDESAKAVALDAIAAATGKAKRDVAPILETQLKRFRDFSDAVRATSELIRSPMAAPSAAAIAIEPSPAPSLMMRGNGEGMQSAILPHEPPTFFRTESPVQFSSHQGGFFGGPQPNIGSNFEDRTLNLGPPVKHPRTENLLSLREIYAKTLHEESLYGGENGMRFSVQIDRPVMWVDSSPDPKYICAGWNPIAYTTWKEHAEKRKAQGAPQKFVTYITLTMLDMVCTMTRSSPSLLLSLTDEALTLKLDTKFNIAQETNLLLMKFAMPTRPTTLPIWELHLPITEWSNYVSKWLKELRSQQEAGKDLEKYELSEVFTQGLIDFKLIYDHSRVLTKLPVRDLIASCSDFLQEQVISEQRSANARKQQGIEIAAAVPTKAPHGLLQTQTTQGKRDDSKVLTHGLGAMTMKQARAFMTEAATLAKTAPAPPVQGGGAAKNTNSHNATVPRDFLIAFTKLPFHDVHCEGCGKWYKNAPDRPFPSPCTGRCQYEGHPVQNTKYKQGVKWNFPGYCCTWKGMQDKDIPPATLARLQKYSSQKRQDKSY